MGFSFNGGKDSVVLAALVLHVATRLSLDSGRTHELGSCKIGDVRTIFFLMKNDYPEMIRFMAQFGVDFQLNVHEITVGFKQGLFELMDEDRKRGRDVLKAMFMGTRRDDPDGKHQTVFSPTDPSWPPLCRVNPILEFQYHDIWQFLRIYKLPYCSLYDRGFTSIGTIDDTTTNELLWNSRTSRYVSPWLLPHGKYERIGRGCRRFFACRQSLDSFLDYPPEVLASITKYLELPLLIGLSSSGNRRLMFKLQNGGVNEVRYANRNARPNFEKCLPLFGPIRSIFYHYRGPNLRQDPLQFCENIYMHLPDTLTSLSANWTEEGDPAGPDHVPFPDVFNLPSLRHLCIELKDVSRLSHMVNPNLHTLALNVTSRAEEVNALLSQLPELKTLYLRLPLPGDSIVVPKNLETLVLAKEGIISSTVESLPETLTSLDIRRLFGLSFSRLPKHFPSSLKELKIATKAELKYVLLSPKLETLVIADRMLDAAQACLSENVKRWVDYFGCVASPIGTGNKACREGPISVTRIDAPRLHMEFGLVSGESSDQDSVNGEGVFGRDEERSSHSNLMMTFPDALTDMNFVLVPNHGNADLARLPSNLVRLKIAIPDIIRHRFDYRLLPQRLTSLSLNQCGLNTSVLRVLPRTLKTLRISCSSTELKEDHADRTFSMAFPEYLADIPPSLTHLAIRDVKEFAPALPYLPGTILVLDLERENSIDDFCLHLLPRHLHTLRLPQNTQSFCKRLADLPRTLTELDLSRANLHDHSLPSSEQLEHLPLHLKSIRLGKLQYNARRPTPLFWMDNIEGPNISSSQSF